MLIMKLGKKIKKGNFKYMLCAAVFNGNYSGNGYHETRTVINFGKINNLMHIKPVDKIKSIT